ncbi:MAG: YggT family protein [Gemmatimonadales bacterium]
MLVARGLVLTGLFFAATVAVTHWAVRRKHLAPFGPWPRFVRSMSDPAIHALERRIVRAGRNPQDAPMWLLGIVVVGGLVLLTLMEWLTGAWFHYGSLIGAGPRGWAFLVVNGTFGILMTALIVRIIGSWFGVGRYRSWMKPAYWLTDWFLNPIGRFLPPMGMIDFSPLVAWVLLMVLRGFILGFIV